jgi:hypothetical protein
VPHEWPHDPQLLASRTVSTHADPHSISPEVQRITHALATHI